MINTTEDDSDESFLHAFQSASLPFELWNHKAHLRMTYLTLLKHEHNNEEAYQQIKQGITHSNSIHAEKLIVGFHETITRFWFEMVVDAVEKDDSVVEGHFESFLLAHPELLQTKLLFDRDILLKEPKSRVEWVPPDMQAMPFRITK